jgi:hypothetical protein
MSFFILRYFGREQITRDLMLLPLFLSKRPKDSVVIAAPWTGDNKIQNPIFFVTTL